MKEIFEYDGVDEQDFDEAIETLGEDKFLAITLLTTAEMVEEHGDDLLDKAEEAREKAKELLEEEADES